jgi:hypothetical protein
MFDTLKNKTPFDNDCYVLALALISITGHNGPHDLMTSQFISCCEIGVLYKN